VTSAPPAAAPAPAPPPVAGPAPGERALLLVLSAVQFVNIVDFMMVMPLGPDFSRDLGIDPAHLGLVGGAYTGAAAIAGVAGSAVLDRFDRRSALVACAVGLSIGTLAGALAWDLPSLLAARVLAGCFGGPASALALAIVSDVVPPARRGRAMGFVMGAFSIASVLGVPAGLELARLGGWRAPFVGVGAAGLVVAAAGRALLPALRGHLDARGPAIGFAELARAPGVVAALGVAFTVTLARFSIIPYISPFLLFNLGLPREDLGGLYMLGGLASLGVLRVAGPLVDRLGATALVSASSIVVIATTAAGFSWEPSLIAPAVLFPLFMGGTSAGNVAVQTITSMVPRASERARFQSAQSSLQHVGAAAGAMIGAAVLGSEGGERLVGMPRLAVISMVLTAVIPFLIEGLRRRLRARS